MGAWELQDDTGAVQDDMGEAGAVQDDTGAVQGGEAAQDDMGTVPGSRGSHSIAWNIRGDGGVYLGLLVVIAFRLFNPARSSGIFGHPSIT